MKPCAGVGKCPFLVILNITFKYLLEMKYPQWLGDVKHWDIYQPLRSVHWSLATLRLKKGLVKCGGRIHSPVDPSGPQFPLAQWRLVILVTARMDVPEPIYFWWTKKWHDWWTMCYFMLLYSLQIWDLKLKVWIGAYGIGKPWNMG